MQKFLAIVLLAIAALEGVVAAPVTDAAAVDVHTNEKSPASPIFDHANDLYGGFPPPLGRPPTSGQSSTADIYKLKHELT